MGTLTASSIAAITTEDLGYVFADDVLPVLDTIEEVFTFYAEFVLPAAATTEEKKVRTLSLRAPCLARLCRFGLTGAPRWCALRQMRVMGVIDLMGLRRVQRSVVGGSLGVGVSCRGISGGERRRVSIGYVSSRATFCVCQSSRVPGAERWHRKPVEETWCGIQMPVVQMTVVSYSNEKVANRTVGCEIVHAAVSRRPPISLTKIVPRATRTPRKFGICPSFQDHFLSPRAQTEEVAIRQLLHRCRVSVTPPTRTDAPAALMQRAALCTQVCSPQESSSDRARRAYQWPRLRKELASDALVSSAHRPQAHGHLHYPSGDPLLPHANMFAYLECMLFLLSSLWLKS